ncbi:MULTISPECIES: FimV/HubP family polar landmark protein [Aquincola]|uniref:FimV/HubP family polar landmark protein n=1 Tax=Aquincola TaxID=391952 RepID=UPI0009F8929D|nr:MULTISPECIES: FimV/HubP family polar landmark protein [Aquincola]MCR5865306.1 hypothetical protein [Aquincola sp. J276]
MKKRSLAAHGPALSAVAVAALLCATAPAAWALGLGRVAVQSSLGESLRAEIDVTSISPEEASTLRLRVASPEAYRAAGVDYNPVLPGTSVQLLRRPDGRPYVRLTSDRAVQEPFVDVILDISWASGRLVREYTMLFDPPGRVPPPPAVAAAPVPPSISAAPLPPPVQRPASPRPAPQPPAPPVAPAPALPPVAQVPVQPPAAAQPVPASPAAPSNGGGTPRPAPRAPGAAGGDQYAVRQGETLYRIATNTQHPGVSLDQMLVALYRSNPQAFMDDNMNRMRAGAVLTVPTPEQVRQISGGEARQVIQAQSADFSAYRQRLAGVVPSVRPDEPARQARGQVQAQVDDRKQAAAPTPDRLRLSQGSVQASAPEARASGEAQRRDEAARVAELARNVEDLKRLQAGTGTGAGVGAASPASGPAAPGAVPGVAVPSPVPPAGASAPLVPPTATAPASTPAPAVAPGLPSASAPVVPAAPVAVAPSAPARPASAPAAPATTPAAADEEPGLLADNPLLLPGAGLLVLLLAGLGYYRWKQKKQADSGETSFLESRLQPDSFFGATGGQRIDTREATGNSSSSMTYSLSQLDAIGDVDPVAEADVYLAYGRDLQAEEILKEAMRSDPGRLAVRTKLLEVYAKRRDTKGYELLATQLYSMTRGEGEDWQKAQQLGQQIDPENPLYQPGGSPSPANASSSTMNEPLGASTMPQSVLPAMGFATTSPSLDADLPPISSLELDLDLDQPTQPGDLSPMSMEATRPIGLVPSAGRDDNSLDFDLPTTAPRSEYADPSASVNTAPMDLDLDSLSLDLDLPPEPPAVDRRSTTPADLEFDLGDLEDFGGAGVADTATADLRDGGDDPLQRKFELADEFRQIGDVEGARDLLEEVVAKASGPLKARAQNLLDNLE